MYTIRPFMLWQHLYDTSSDEHFLSLRMQARRLPYSVYNYILQEDWEDFGSSTLYYKMLCVDYVKKFAIIELIGEWNDSIENDILTLQNNLISLLTDVGICFFVLIMDYVMQSHIDNFDYYEAWHTDLNNSKGWVCFLNVIPHNEEALREVLTLPRFFICQLTNWRQYQPVSLIQYLKRKHKCV